MADTRTTGNLTAGEHLSLWTESVVPLEYAKLENSLKTEVIIVGGGIAGLMTAYGLLERGKKVVVVEDGVIGSGETGRTTAHLTLALDDRYYELERIFGKEDTKLAASSHLQAINYYEQIIQTEQIDCDFRRVDGYLFTHPSDKPENLEKEFAAATEAGVKVEICDKMPGINSKEPAIRFPQQAQIHPLKFLNGLAAAITRKGGKIFCNTHAKHISSKGISTNEGHLVEAEIVVVATNSPVNDKFVMHMKQSSYRTYVTVFTVPKDSLPYALWWDSGDFEKNKDVPPYHYVRVQPLDDQFDVLIAGGEDHPVGLTEQGTVPEEDRYEVLEKWVRKYFNVGQLISRWSGEVREPADCLAYIGRNPMDEDNVFIVTGDSGNGMTHGAIAGLLLPELIEQKDHPWRRIYSPSRLKFRSAGILLREFTSGFMQYLRNKPKDAKENTLTAIDTGQAKVVEMEGKKYGAFRDEMDQLHIVSITCTHLGCILNWNGDERSWDCPCHGSRFSYEGKVLNGPANEDLTYHREEHAVFMDTISKNSPAQNQNL